MRTVVFIFVLTILVVGTAAPNSPSTTVDQMLGQYVIVQQNLASDSINGIAASAAEITKISREAAATETHGKTQLIALSEVAAKLNATDLKSARNGFGELSDRLISYLQAAAVKRNPPYQFYCPMVKKNWLQPDKQTRNPYYGRSMLKCGELVQSEQPPKQPAEQETGRHH